MKSRQQQQFDVRRGLNSNIGCFEMLNPKRQTSDCRMLNSNIGCFEMLGSAMQNMNAGTLNSNIGCFEMNLTHRKETSKEVKQ